MVTNKMIDVTDMIPAAFEVFLDAKCGADFVDCAHLSVVERRQVANALDWPNDSRTRAWCEDSYPALAERDVYIGPDVEGMIFEAQEDDGRNVG